MPTSTTIAEADQLAAHGRLLDALRLLSIANRVRRDTLVELRLIELRRNATISQPSARRPRRWPPRARDLFAHGTDIPEITADALTPATLRSGIVKHGCLLVRGLIPTPRVEQLVADIDHAFDAHDAYMSGTHQAQASPWFVPFEPRSGESVPREWVRSGDGVLAVDSPRTFFDVTETFEEAGVRDLVTGFLEENPVLLANKWTLRRVPPRSNYGRDFHQDGAFMGHDIRTLDLWVSLSHCGTDAPGLDLVAKRFDSILTAGNDDALFEWSIDEDALKRTTRAKVVRPVFAPGDALFLDHLLPHRTAYGAEMINTRYAIEAWFAAPSSYPSTGMPIWY